MNQLFSIGKSLIKNKNNGGGTGNIGNSNVAGGSSSGGFNPLAMFKQLDKNGDGKITEEDFVIVINQLGLGSIGEMAVKGIFRQIDTNRNGVLDIGIKF